MTRVFLAAGVAALAIAAPASAGPHGGGRGGQAAYATGGGGQRAQAVRGGGGGGFAAPRVQRQAFSAPRMQRQAFAAPRMQRQAFAAPRVQRQQRFAAIERPQRANRVQMSAARPQHMQAQTRMANRQQMRANRVQQAQTMRANRVQQARNLRANRVQQAQTMRANRVQQAQNLRANRVQQAQNMRANRVQQAQNMRAERLQQTQTRIAQQQQMRMNRQQQVQAQLATRQQLQANRMAANVNGRAGVNNGVGYGVGGCPPGLASKSCMPPGQAAKLGFTAGTPIVTAQTAAALRTAQVQALNANLGTHLVAPVVAASLLGVPVNTAPSLLGMGLSPVPQPISYLYPDTSQYYYQYAPGYMYQVDRSTSLIDALIPLLGGGYLPGSYLPQSYMSSYVPDYYGLNSFYPASYGPDYGYGYANMCNRYANGVIYQVDCMTGMVENVVPMYAGGYGVGQMLPSAYSYYNVPMQYRSMYYPTADASYWYAPGAIYQYDPSSSLITSVAALMSPGFTVGQPLPMGYDMYNVPMAYRATYYDTPNAWYRYNNGYIYQIDPATQLVTAIVASLLT